MECHHHPINTRQSGVLVVTECDLGGLGTGTKTGSDFTNRKDYLFTKFCWLGGGGLPPRPPVPVAGTVPSHCEIIFEGKRYFSNISTGTYFRRNGGDRCLPAADFYSTFLSSQKGPLKFLFPKYRRKIKTVLHGQTVQNIRVFQGGRIY